MNNELLLQGKAPIPFMGAHVSIHNPDLTEISMIGEASFQIGTRFLNFSKDMLSEEDKSSLEDKTDFDIFMSIMRNREQKASFKNDVLMILTLLFPTFNIAFVDEGIRLTNVETQTVTHINNENFLEFKDILNSMFDMHDVQNGNGFNPADKRAAKIAEKLQRGRQKVAQSKGQDSEKVSIFARYVSILAVGERKDKNELMHYTVYQLLDEFKRWQLENAFDINLRARLAGATNLEEAENWMDDIHDVSKNKNK